MKPVKVCLKIELVSHPARVYLIQTVTITPDQSEPGSHGNQRVLHIPQTSGTEASPLDVFWGKGRFLQEI